MTFANFIVGNSNRMAQNAALLVSTKPGMNFNPLFLYSHPGLGKTHLLNAIGNKAKETNPNLLVRYIRWISQRGGAGEKMKSCASSSLFYRIVITN